MKQADSWNEIANERKREAYTREKAVKKKAACSTHVEVKPRVEKTTCSKGRLQGSYIYVVQATDMYP